MSGRKSFNDFRQREIHLVMYSYPMLFVSASTNQQEVRRDACHLRSLTTRQGFIPLNSVQVRDRGRSVSKISSLGPPVDHPKGVQGGGITSNESVLSTTRFPEAVWADEPMVH